MRRPCWRNSAWGVSPRGACYLLREVFGLEDRCLLVPPSEKEGRFVLREVLRAGNFGQSNADIRRGGGKTAAYFLSSSPTACASSRPIPVKPRGDMPSGDGNGCIGSAKGMCKKILFL